MRIAVALCFVILLSCVQRPLIAQEPNFPQPTPAHEFLKKFTGEWEAVSKGQTAPDQPENVVKGKVTSKMLGGFWVVNEIETYAGEVTVKGLQTIGYDPEKKKYIGTWVDSMTNFLWKYEGTLDESGKKIMLDAMGPNFMGEGEMTPYRDSYEFKSPDHIHMTSAAKVDGKWVTFMTSEMKRKK